MKRAWWVEALSLIAVGALILGVVLGGSALMRDSAPMAPGHEIYIISISRLSLAGADVWLLEYAIDGRGEMVQIPIDKDPEAYMTYLARLGSIHGRN